MSAARTDARFLLPRPATSATLMGSGEGWQPVLGHLGVRVDGDGRDLVVAGGAEARAALARAADSAILEDGAPRRVLRAAGWAARRFLPLPRLEDPHVVLPLGHHRAVRYALTEWIVPPSRVKRWRNQVSAPLLSRGVVPSGWPLITVASRRPGPPFLLRAAEAHGVDLRSQWFLVPGHGDLLSRGVFLLFPPGARGPDRVLKFSRVPGQAEPLERDAVGLRLAERAGGSVARHSPRLLARFAVDGFEASLESAAQGQRLIALLTSAAPRARKLAVVDGVAGWAVALAGATRAHPDALAAERARLRDEVVAGWAEHGVAAEIVDRLDGVPAALAHNDLGTWNITTGDGFTVIDWESAREHGLPLWDLWYFLADALAHVDGASALERREAHFRRLFRGELESSELLFRWTRRAVADGLAPAAAVGPLATLCFLHHGLSGELRVAAARRSAIGILPAPWLEHSRRMALAWLADPRLGVEWTAWRDARPIA